jgi:GDPmannose 4,6-dehydratase
LAARHLGFSPEFEGEGLHERCFDKKSGKLLAEVHKEFFREPDTKALRGDFSKIKSELGWSPTTTFESLVGLMAGHDLSVIKDKN